MNSTLEEATRPSGDAALPLTPPPGAKVMIGGDGWLFLDNDTNDSVGQYIGRTTLDKRALTLWRRSFAAVDALSKDLGFRYAYLLAPSKEAVYDEVYPHRSRRAAVRPVEAVIAAAPAGVPVIYPTELLREARAEAPTYDRGDSHWNHFAGFQVVNLVLRTALPDAGVQLSADDFEFQRGVLSVGDLQNKIPGWPKTERITARRRGAAPTLTFDSELRNRGRTLVYRNADAPLRSAVMFGDSFGWSLDPFLAASFRRFVHVHSTSPDRSVIEQERPDFVLIEATERFAINGPAAIETYRIEQIARAKLTRTPAEERAALRERYLAMGEAELGERFYADLFARACG